MKENETFTKTDTVSRCSTQQEIAPIYRSQDLLRGKREMFILHGNEVYHLIRTRNDKLILQK